MKKGRILYFCMATVICLGWLSGCHTSTTDSSAPAITTTTTTALSITTMETITTNAASLPGAAPGKPTTIFPAKSSSVLPTTTNTIPAAAIPSTFQNPLSKTLAPDPNIQYIDGYYYALYTQSDRITLFRSRSLETVFRDQQRLVYVAGNQITGNIWAPELHYSPSTEKWYIYASGSTQGNDFSTIRMFCLESLTSNPFGNYMFKSLTDPDTHAIDQTVFYDDGSRMLYTAYSQFTSAGQVIMLATMENPWTISADRARVSYPQYSWEQGGAVSGKDARVNEGPAFLYHRGKLHLIYSASGCWSPDYCLGMLAYTAPSINAWDMLQLANWKKHPEAVFSAANDVYGVGHCSFFTSPDGSETWMAYHGMATPTAGEGGRFAYTQKIGFDANGVPVLGSPLPRSTLLQIPS